MASPIGHALAGVAVAWGVDLLPGNRAWRIAPPSASGYERAGKGLTLACAVLAAGRNPYLRIDEIGAPVA